MIDGIRVTHYGYDAAGQILSEDGPWVDDTVSYTYANRLRTNLSLAQPNASAWMQSYPYDQAGNLATRVFPASLLLPRLENFGVNSLNELTNYARGAGTLAVAGTTTSPATNVTVNTTNASLYADSTFAALGFTLTNGINTYTAIAKDAYGRRNRGTYDRTGLQGGKGVCIGCRRCQAGRK